jgi:hypothetical protein
MTFSFDLITDQIARVTDTIPEKVEVGFHICSMWHVDPAPGQDNQVFVDYINCLLEKVHCPLAYFHMATSHDHGPDEFALLKNVKLGPGTRLFLGVIHLDDGLEGAASTSLDDFGVAFVCGFGPGGVGSDPQAAERLLRLHRDVAELG